jgi:exodeoxyribonuclease VII large subunit
MPASSWGTILLAGRMMDFFPPADWVDESLYSLSELGGFGTATRPLSVGQITVQIKDQLETCFPEVWVAGEVSNFSRPRSGHCYFTLRDSEAQLRAVLWRMAAARLPFQLRDGLQIVCRGSLEVYAARGTYQLTVRHVQPQGLGALELALRQLKARLDAEGLFDPALKRPLPRFPRRVALVTSPSGAAIRDFLQVLQRRWGGTDVLVVPTRVQGDGAAAEIAAAVARVDRLRRKPDCLVLTRGGGSLEDLWAFNEEAVVRAIHACSIPVVSAVGHEIDVTLADLAADVRALTPSEAAERVAPDADEISGRLRQVRGRLLAALKSKAASARGRLDALASLRVLRRPAERIHDLSRELDDLQARASRAVGHRLRAAHSAVVALAGRLESLSPLAVLQRGYSLTRRETDERLIRDAAQLRPGERIVTRLAQGQVTSRVEDVG